jgi:hypothetical protein
MAMGTSTDSAQNQKGSKRSKSGKGKKVQISYINLKFSNFNRSGIRWKVHELYFRNEPPMLNCAGSCKQ